MLYCGNIAINYQYLYKSLFSYLWALSLVPRDEVVKVWETHILDNAQEADEDAEYEDEESLDEVKVYNTNLKRYLTYIEGTYIGARNERRPELPRRKPRIAIELWNKHDDLLDGLEVTNNMCESFNSVSKAGLPMNPSIWVVLEKLQKEESLVRLKVSSINPAANVSDHQERDRRRRAKREKLVQIISSYKSSDINTFMSRVAAFYNY